MRVKALSATAEQTYPLSFFLSPRSLSLFTAAQPEPQAPPHPSLNPPRHEPLLLKQLLEQNAAYNWSLGDNCAPYPRHEDLQYEQDYYQFTMGGNVSYYFFAAYYDRRQAMEYTPSIAVLAMVSSIFGPFEPAHCQVWYEGSARPDIVEMHHQEIGWYDAWGNGPDHVYPVLMNCPLHGTQRRHRVPQLVSLVWGDECSRPSNAMRVVYEAPERRRSTRFAVCLKDLHFPDADMTDRWLEWLELMRLLGVERVTAYDLGAEHLQESTRRTLRHYSEEDGLLVMRSHTLLNGHPEPAANGYLSKLLNEVLMYIDCYYRNIYLYDYVGNFDVDEVIMPLGELNNWTALVELLEGNRSVFAGPNNEMHCEERASFCFRNIYFPKDLPQDERSPANFYMLRHVIRVAEHLDAGSAIKCLHSTAHNTILHNHFSMGWRGCGALDVPTNIGQMQHYREPDIKETLHDPPPVRDDNIWRFKEQLIERVMAKRRQLGLPPA